VITRHLAVLAAAFLLAGCAGATSAASPTGVSPSAGARATAPPAEPPSKPSAEPPSGFEPSAKAPGAAIETLSGTVVAGVEPDCLLLQGDGSHLLLFQDPALRSQATAGSSITVTGRSEPGQATTCQQGVPFVVAAVRAN
jgi:hypothetical protein